MRGVFPRGALITRLINSALIIWLTVGDGGRRYAVLLLIRQRILAQPSYKYVDQRNRRPRRTPRCKLQVDDQRIEAAINANKLFSRNYLKRVHAYFTVYKAAIAG